MLKMNMVNDMGHEPIGLIDIPDGQRERSRDRQPRVAHIVPALFGGSDGIVGGAERYAFELARSMADVAPTKLITFGEQDRKEKDGLLEIQVLGKSHFVRGQRSNPVSLGLLRAVLSADVIHCHQQHVVASSIAAALCRITGRKVFVSDLGGGGWDVSGYLSTDKWYHGHLHISEYSRAVAAHTSNSRAHVILGGVDIERFSSPRNASGDGGILFVGRILPHKGINYLIEGLRRGMRLTIVGTPYDQRHATDLKEMSGGKAVTFLHGLDDSALIRQYQSSIAIVLPSVYRDMYGNTTRVPELLGQTLLEGMACGLPAICTAVASMPEIVTDGVTGFVVPPNNGPAIHEKLSWLRDHPEAAREMGAAARKRVLEYFTWPAVVQRCLEIYSQ